MSIQNTIAVRFDWTDWTEPTCRPDLVFPHHENEIAQSEDLRHRVAIAQKVETDRKTCSAVRRVLFWLCEVVFLATWSRGLP